MPTIQQLAAYGPMLPVSAGQPQSQVGGYPVPSGGDYMSAQPVTQAASTTPAAAGNTGPAFSWLALVAVMVLIRVAYEKAGARLE